MDERRRQRRQQRIIEASQSRLSKITGNVQPEKTFESPAQPTLQRRNSTDDPSDELGAPEPISAMNTNPFGQGMFGDSSFAQAMGTGFPGSEKTVEDSSPKYWNLLHLIVMTLLGVYTAYNERNNLGRDVYAGLLSESNTYTEFTSLFWYFAVLEVGLQSARLVLQKGQMTSTSTFAAIATQLPYPIGSALTVFLRYKLIGSCLIQDISILVFVLGISIVLSSIV